MYRGELVMLFGIVALPHALMLGDEVNTFVNIFMQWLSGV